MTFYTIKLFTINVKTTTFSRINSIFLSVFVYLLYFLLKRPVILAHPQLQSPQGLSGHFEMALPGRKKVAMLKLMVASNSQRRNNFIQVVSFYVPIKLWPQQPHKVQV